MNTNSGSMLCISCEKFHDSLKGRTGYQSISQLYMEAHTVSHVLTRTQGDSSLNNALNSSLEQEIYWTTKKSTMNECEASYEDAQIQCAPGGDFPEFNGEQSVELQKHFNVNVRIQTKASLLVKYTK